MSDCWHCDIHHLVQERFERGDTDLVGMASMMVESLADLILLAPKSDRSNLMAHVLSAFGQIVLEKGGAIDGGSTATH
jgi:ABC-type tungstate transport system substrate-binding protein